MQRKQFLVKLENENKANKFIKYLENNGFLNVHNITFNKLRIKVLLVNKNEFFSTNITCLAALSNYGIKPISIDEFKTTFEAEFNINNDL